eukprot:COSAG02_NODE_66569_length_255_cov_0.653846_1_plen_84_part_11
MLLLMLLMLLLLKEEDALVLLRMIALRSRWHSCDASYKCECATRKAVVPKVIYSQSASQQGWARAAVPFSIAALDCPTLFQIVK